MPGTSWRRFLAAGTDEAEDEEETTKTRKVCTPKAHERARREAAQAFVVVENKVGNRIDLQEAKVPGADLFRADFFSANLRGANLRGANLRGANLREASLRGIEGTDPLTGANLYDADLAGANLSETNLRGLSVADLCVNLTRANLTNANLTGANLRGANHSDAELNDIQLRLVLFTVGFFPGRKLTQDQINSAKGNEQTQLPPPASPCPTTGRATNHPAVIHLPDTLSLWTAMKPEHCSAKGWAATTGLVI